MVSPRRALIKHHNAGLPDQFDPKRFRVNDKALDFSIAEAKRLILEAAKAVASGEFSIEEAKRIKEWEVLKASVDLKIEQLQQFVAWWKREVTPGGKGGDRKSKDHSNRPVTVISEPEAKRLTGVGKMQKLRIEHRLKDRDGYKQKLLDAGYLVAQLADPDHFRAQGTGNNEWHTPKKYIELVRAVLGEIDLDPASSEKAQETVCAKQFYTVADNGLTKEWRGNTWLNPPYSPKEIAAFVAKLCDELRSGNVAAAIMLTHNYTDSGWFQKAAGQATAICFPDTRIRFEDPDGVPCSPTQGQAFFYFGNDVGKFSSTFVDVGFVVVPM